MGGWGVGGGLRKKSSLHFIESLLHGMSTWDRLILGSSISVQVDDGNTAEGLQLI